MTASNGYAVFFFPQALETLGAAITPYLQDSPAGPHVLCNEIDTGGSLLEMTLQGITEGGGSVQLELMVPTSMVRMIVSSQSDGVFGFGPRAQDVVGAVEPGGRPAGADGQSAPGGTQADPDAGAAPGTGPGDGKTPAGAVKREPARD